MQIPSIEDFERLERKLDKILERQTKIEAQLSEYDIPKEYLLRPKRVMELLDIKQFNFDQLVTEGKLRKIYISERTPRIPWEDVQKLLSL